MADILISRQPLLNRQSRIIANRLRLHLPATAGAQKAVSTLDALSECWPQGEKSVFVSCEGRPFDIGLLQWQIPANATLELSSEALLDSGGSDLLAALQARQPSFCLKFDARIGEAMAAGARPRFLGFDVQRHEADQLQKLVGKTQPYGMALAFGVDTPEQFRIAVDAGVSGAAGWFFKTPGDTGAKKLAPAQAHIIRVLNLVRNGAHVKEIELALKQDVALSYKLLRYINSAGFGLSCEIQSFGHAVTILGYDKLHKWLSLLLVTASPDPMAQALMHTALTRAHLMEVLAQGLVDRSEYDNLFITGAFSLLDVLLGVDMEQVLDAMHLPEPVCDALLGRGGVYAPFLDLARASETNDGDDGQALEAQVGMLGLSGDTFNRAQLQALAFAEAMEH